ncbi:hypothetical protein Nepgr_010983 [Nepenthes gracilis]|uniref:Uncharacterized protein n=1 Tax=Nepenthes gracilis TaxID=150966 RepID=A0AAD3SDF1_NEPGR|nr:hypothetical protein Nepgr_010983 [Nepenthes gracilis]
MQCDPSNVKIVPYDTTQLKQGPSWLDEDYFDSGPPLFNTLCGMMLEAKATHGIVTWHYQLHQIGKGYLRYFVVGHSATWITLLWQANTNQHPFKGFAIIVVEGEGHLEILEILLKTGPSQPTCEEARLETSYNGRVGFVELILGPNLIRPHASVHALGIVHYRGFKDVFDVLWRISFSGGLNWLTIGLRIAWPSRQDHTALVDLDLGKAKTDQGGRWLTCNAFPLATAGGKGWGGGGGDAAPTSPFLTKP